MKNSSENNSLIVYENNPTRKDEDQIYMSVEFKYWCNTQFTVVDPDEMKEAYISLSAWDLKTLWLAIIERLKDTPNRINI